MKARLPVFKRAQIIRCTPAEVVVYFEEVAFEAKLDCVVYTRVYVVLTVYPPVSGNKSVYNVVKIFSQSKSEGA